MPVRSAKAEWKGDLKGGTGTVTSETGSVDSAYSFPTRFGDERGTNPEELIASAHAACFSMALSHGLASAGHTPESVRTEARVHLDQVEGGFAITKVVLRCEAKVPGISEEAFREQAEGAKKGCPVSRALRAIDIELDARLV